MSALRFSQWEQPVTSRPWAIVAVIVWNIQLLTGHRLAGKYAHGAWQKACGI